MVDPITQSATVFSDGKYHSYLIAWQLGLPFSKSETYSLSMPSVFAHVLKLMRYSITLSRVEYMEHLQTEHVDNGGHHLHDR